MSRRNMMGFKPVEVIPPKAIQQGKSIYDPVIDKVIEEGTIYGNDTKDLSRAKSLVATLFNRVKARNLEDKVGIVRRYTVVYIVKK